MPESNENMLSSLAQILAVQCPLPGQPGAPSFNGKDVSVFLRNWERFASKYRFPEDRKVADLQDYCDPGVATYVEALIKVAKEEATVAAAGSADAGGLADAGDEALWGAVRRLLLAKFKKDDTEQHRIAVPFLRALVKDKGFRTDAEAIERYVYQYKDISTALLDEGELTEIDRVVWFLQGLPDRMGSQIYTIAKLDIDNRSLFREKGCFTKVVEAALNINRTSTGYDRLLKLSPEPGELPVEAVRRILIREPQAANKNQLVAAPAPTTPEETVPNDQVAWEERMAGIEKGIEKLMLYHQTAATTNANTPAGNYGNYRPSGNASMRGRPYHPMPGRVTRNVMAGANQEQTGGAIAAPVSYRGCRWCGVDGHLKYQCADYGRSLSEGAVHFVDQADQKTRMGPVGAGGVVVPLPEFTGLWQKEWVERERKRGESQMAGALGAEGNAGSGAVVRQLTVEDVREVSEEGVPYTEASMLTLQPGQICELVAVADGRGDVQGWIETKRAADDMGDTITLDPSSRLRKRQATEASYPRAGPSQAAQSVPPRPTVAFAQDDEDIPDAGNAREPEETQETLPADASEHAMVRERKKRASGGGATQGPRRVPVQLRAEAEPEKMVDKILNQTIDDITIREVLGLSPDLLREIWGIRRFPTVKASIPATQVSEQATIVIPDEPDIGVHQVRAALHAAPARDQASENEAAQHLYACASPMVLGKVEGKYKVNMLVDSGSEMCVMSKNLWQQMRMHLPIDTEISWSVGSANATHNRVFGVCHSVAVSIGGVEIDVPVFVLEGAAQDFILGRPWERKTRAQYDNREDGSLYITISTLDNQRRAVFCAVAERSERNRDRVRLLKGKAVQQAEN